MAEERLKATRSREEPERLGGPGGYGEGWGVCVPEGRNIHEQLLWGSRLLFITHKKKNKVAFGTTHLSRVLKARWGELSSSAPLPFAHPRLLVPRAAVLFWNALEPPTVLELGDF